MTSRTRTPSAAAAASVLWAVPVVLGAALVPALLPGTPAAVASEAGGASESADTTRPRDAVTLTPASGAAGAVVVVRAQCASEAEDAAVFSPAFAYEAALRRGPGGAMEAVAVVRDGLTPGHAYVVTANCSPVESLTTTFVHRATDGPAAGAGTAAAPARDAGTGPTRVAEDRDPNRVDGVALAFGGGLAGAALAGYLLTARRAAARRRAARRRSRGADATRRR